MKLVLTTRELACLCGYCGQQPVVDNSRVCLPCQDDDNALVEAVYGPRTRNLRRRRTP